MATDTKSNPQQSGGGQSGCQESDGRQSILGQTDAGLATTDQPKRTRRRMFEIVTAIVGMLLVISVGGAIWSVDDWSRDLTTNHARLSPGADDPSLRPIESSATVVEMSQRIARWVESKPKWNAADSTESRPLVEKPEVESDSVDSVTLQLTRTTPLMRFVDDIQVTIVKSNAGCRVNAESRSRVGKGDLGQNPRNLKEIVAGIADDRAEND